MGLFNYKFVVFLLRTEFLSNNLFVGFFFIIIEFNQIGEHHYHNMDVAFGPNGTASLYSERDLQKMSLCQTHGITLIFIPYWYGCFSSSCRGLILNW
jgi:hypothetical protein